MTTPSYLLYLELPLPSWCITGPYPLVSGQVLPLLSELSGWPTSLSADCRDSRHTLAGVFNLTLSTVADIRSLIAHYGPLCSAVPFVSALMRVLAQICVSDGIVITDVNFVRPRTATPCCGEFDGIAAFLACRSVQTFLEMTLSLDNASDSSNSSSAVPCLDVLLDAHVLPGHGKHLSAILPFLCVADIDHIADFMSSLACQHHVWGIPEPARTARTVRPATQSNSAPPAKMGIFDFTDVVSALSFANLILNLSSGFIRISKRAVLGCEKNGLDWHSDSIPSENLAYGQDRITRWLIDAFDRMLVPSSRSPSESATEYGNLPYGTKAILNANLPTPTDQQTSLSVDKPRKTVGKPTKTVDKPPKSYKSSSTCD
ncbi:hypothetical protein B0H19DRAFT_1386637 [Mycena capillaripes]|nr:hypothetical protein B0H19DRAFT_1386637 [Mycena capillaripes]